ncbi:MAG: FAD-dependent oxidoreductase [Aquabacterium sp.]
MDTSAAPVQRDVIVIGAGLAGSATAVVLARRGMSVTVVDPYPTFPPLFRAEKIEPDQAALLRKLQLFDAVQPSTRLIREIIHGRGGRILYRRPIEQFGISYCDIVNQVRACFPAGVDLRHGRVEAIVPDAVRPAVTLADGTRLDARLVVIANGMGDTLTAALGASRRMIHEDLSLAFGFMLERADGNAFDFDAVTYRPVSTADRVGYITLFRMGQHMRGNLFAYWPARDAATRDVVRDPGAALLRLLPGLDRVISPFKVVGKVEPFKIDLYRLQDCARPGVVAIGDAYQSVCPTTGTGLSKVLTDVDVLCNAFVPDWMASGAIDAAATARFYAHADKTAKDEYSLRHALLGRSVSVDKSLKWRLRRMIRSLRFAHGW